VGRSSCLLHLHASSSICHGGTMIFFDVSRKIDFCSSRPQTRPSIGLHRQRKKLARTSATPILQRTGLTLLSIESIEATNPRLALGKQAKAITCKRCLCFRIGYIEKIFYVLFLCREFIPVNHMTHCVSVLSKKKVSSELSSGLPP